MTRQVIILIGLLIFSGAVYGQTKRSSKYPPPPSLNDKNAACTKNHQFSPKDRLKNYPFNEADSVLIVSFDYSSADTTIFYKSGRLPIKADTLCYAGLSEKFILSVKQINSLTDILYNYDYIGKVEFEKNTNCYDPHNAIVFLDKQGKMFEYIEICFLCERHEKSSPKIKTGNFCDGKYDLLKKYFKQVGLTIGIE